MLLSETSLTVGSVGLIIKRWEKRTTYCISIVIIPFASHRMLSVLTLLFFQIFFFLLSHEISLFVWQTFWSNSLGVRRSNPSKRLKSPDNVCIFFIFSFFFMSVSFVCDWDHLTSPRLFVSSRLADLWRKILSNEF